MSACVCDSVSLTHSTDFIVRRAHYMSSVSSSVVGILDCFLRGWGEERGG